MYQLLIQRFILIRYRVIFSMMASTARCKAYHAHCHAECHADENAAIRPFRHALLLFSQYEMPHGTQRADDISALD